MEVRPTGVINIHRVTACLLSFFFFFLQRKLFSAEIIDVYSTILIAIRNIYKNIY